MARVIEPGHFQATVGGSSDAVKSVGPDVAEQPGPLEAGGRR
jgi:hypothetical protein